MLYPVWVFCSFDTWVILYWMGFSHFVHPSVFRHLDWFYFLAVVNNVSMNFLVRFFFYKHRLFISLGYIPKNRITGSCIYFCEEIPGCFPKWLWFLHSHQLCTKGSSFSTSLPLLVVICFVFYYNNLLCVKCYLIIILICISLRTNSVYHPFIHFTVCVPFLRNVYSCPWSFF